VGLPENVASDPTPWISFAKNSMSSATIPPFEGFVASLPTPYSSPDLTPIEKLVLVKTLAPELLIKAIQSFVSWELGSQFINFPGFSLKEPFAETTAENPLLFILTPGNDPGQ
jgi:hypothetical protein